MEPCTLGTAQGRVVRIGGNAGHGLPGDGIRIDIGQLEDGEADDVDVAARAGVGGDVEGDRLDMDDRLAVAVRAIGADVEPIAAGRQSDAVDAERGQRAVAR